MTLFNRNMEAPNEELKFQHDSFPFSVLFQDITFIMHDIPFIRGNDVLISGREGG